MSQDKSQGLTLARRKIDAGAYGRCESALGKRTSVWFLRGEVCSVCARQSVGFGRMRLFGFGERRGGAEGAGCVEGGMADEWEG